VVPFCPGRYPGGDWTWRGIAEWLAERLSEDAPMLVGIGHGFSFSLRAIQARRASHRLRSPFESADRTRFHRDGAGCTRAQANRMVAEFCVKAPATGTVVWRADVPG
jgi:hypothetical protein